MRSLENGLESTFILRGGRKAQRFRSVSQLQKDLPDGVAQDCVYYWPEAGAKPLESADAFMYVAAANVLYVFQDTVAPSHPVKVKGLLDIIQLAPKKNPPVQIHLVFRLPDDQFPMMRTTQPYMTKEDKVYQDALPVAIRSVTQLVLEVPVAGSAR